MTHQLLNVTLTRLDRRTTIHVDGEVDMSTVHFLGDAMTSALTEDPPNAVVVDLTAVRFLASAGLSALVQGHLRAEEAGIDFTVVATPGGAPERAMAVTGLDLTIRVVNHLDHAVGRTR